MLPPLLLHCPPELLWVVRVEEVSVVSFGRHTIKSDMVILGAFSYSHMYRMSLSPVVLVAPPATHLSVD